MALAALVVAIGFAVAALERASTRTEIDEWTDRQAEVVEALVQDTMDGVVADLEAIAGFVAVSDPKPDLDSFIEFAHRIDGTQSSVGIAEIAVVPAEDLEEHVAEQRAVLGETYEVLGLSGEGVPEPVNQTGREVYYPLQRFAFGALVEPFLDEELALSALGVGVDAGYDPEWRRQIVIASETAAPRVSEFITVDLDLLALEGAFFVSVPIHDGPESDNFVGALMLEPLLLAGIDSSPLNDIVWEVVPPGAIPARVNVEEARFYPITLPGTTWRLAIEPTDEAMTRLVGLPDWILGLMTASIAGLVIMVGWLFAGRRTELRRAARFQRAADDKDRFLASVSHELRTPLTVVSGLAYELSEDRNRFNPDELTELFNLLIDQSEELTGIVEDLLIAARSDIGKVAIHFSEVDVAEEARRAAETADAKVSTNGHAAPALADAQRVRQILRNLLTNANRYGGANVRISLDTSADWIDVTVADDGAGVPLEKREIIFESYESAHQPSAAVKSVGLGLYISRNLARAMGGDLTYEYTEGWSKFRLRLATPRSAHAFAAQPRDDQ